MARLDAKLEITTGLGNEYLCEMQDNYTEVKSIVQTVDNSDEFTDIVTFGTASSIGGDAGIRMAGAKLVVVKNNNDIPIEILIRTTEFKDNSNVDELNSVDLGPDSATSIRSISYIIAANEYMVLPSTWMVSYAEAHSAANAKTISNQGGFDVNSGKLYSAAITDIATALENDTTTFVVDDTDFFRAGDLIQLGSTTGTTVTNIEIARVVSISDSTPMILEKLEGQKNSSQKKPNNSETLVEVNTGTLDRVYKVKYGGGSSGGTTKDDKMIVNNFKTVSKEFYKKLDKFLTYAKNKDVRFFNDSDEELWKYLSNTFTLFNSPAYQNARNFSEEYEQDITGEKAIKKEIKKIA